MKYATLAVCLCLTLSTVTFAAPQKAAASKEKKMDKKVETKDVKVKNLTLKVPTTWEAKKSSSRMRLATYQVKPVEGEKDNAELTVFNFANQGIKANVDRWVGQFSAEGRKTKVSKGSCSTGEYYFVDITGTFKKPKPGAPPFGGEKIDAPNYRMYGVVLPVKGDGMYFLKLTGPTKTVAAQAKSMRGTFGGKKAKEKEHKLN